MNQVKSFISFMGTGVFCSVNLCLFIFFLSFALNSSTCSAQTELGSEDDLTVLGASGTALDPDTEIKGFTVFGSTQAAYTGAVISPGGVVVNGYLAVSSGAYFVGGSTFAAAGAYFTGVSSFSDVANIHIAGGTADQVLKKVAGGGLAWGDGDNLGDHTATQNLTMTGYNVAGAQYVTASSAVLSGQLVVYGTTTLKYVTASSATLSDQLVVYGTSTLSGGARFNGPLVSTGTARIARSLVEAADTGISLTAADFGKTITVDSASNQTVTLPSVTAADIGATVTVVKLGAGKVIIYSGSASLYVGDATTPYIHNNATVPPSAAVTIRLVTATQWILTGGDGAWITSVSAP